MISDLPMLGLMMLVIYLKNKEEDQRKTETKLFNNLKINHNLTENDINDIDVKLQLEHQIQIQETKECGWIFDKINSMKIRFYKTGETKMVRVMLKFL